MFTDFAQQVHESVAAVCPINGVSIGHKDNKGTWVVQFTADATDQQKSAAQAAINAFTYQE